MGERRERREKIRDSPRLLPKVQRREGRRFRTAREDVVRRMRAGVALRAKRARRPPDPKFVRVERVGEAGSELGKRTLSLSREGGDRGMNMRRTIAEDAVVGLTTTGEADRVGVKPISSRDVKRLRHISVDQMRANQVVVFPEQSFLHVPRSRVRSDDGE